MQTATVQESLHSPGSGRVYFYVQLDTRLTWWIAGRDRHGEWKAGRVYAKRGEPVDVHRELVRTRSGGATPVRGARDAARHARRPL